MHYSQFTTPISPLKDDEEFENVDPAETTKDKRSSASKGGEDKQQGVPKTIKIANVPARLQSIFISCLKPFRIVKCSDSHTF